MLQLQQFHDILTTVYTVLFPLAFCYAAQHTDREVRRFFSELRKNGDRANWWPIVRCASCVVAAAGYALFFALKWLEHGL